MKNRISREKLDALLPFRLTAVMRDELEAVARANDQNVQDLVRLAVRAIIRCHHENGGVPLDMELRQREWRPREITSSEQLLNEAEGMVQKKSGPTKGRSPGSAVALYRTKPANASGAASA